MAEDDQDALFAAFMGEIQSAEPAESDAAAPSEAAATTAGTSAAAEAPVGSKRSADDALGPGSAQQPAQKLPHLPKPAQGFFGAPSRPVVVAAAAPARAGQKQPQPKPALQPPQARGSPSPPPPVLPPAVVASQGMVGAPAPPPSAVGAPPPGVPPPLLPPPTVTLPPPPPGPMPAYPPPGAAYPQYPPPQQPGAGMMGGMAGPGAAEARQQEQQGGGAAAGGGSAGGGGGGGGGGGQKKFLRVGGGKKWVDPSLAEWPENDWRLFVGDLPNEVNDTMLADAFTEYPSFNMAKVIKNKWDGKSRGYGFVSFSDGLEMLRALREKNGKYCGSRPMKIRKSTWQERDVKVVRKKEYKAKKEKKALGLL